MPDARELRPGYVDEVRPAVPRDNEFGRCFTPGHSAYMRECRWCGSELQVKAGTLWCPDCDRLHLMTGPSPDETGTRQEGNTA